MEHKEKYILIGIIYDQLWEMYHQIPYDQFPEDFILNLVRKLEFQKWTKLDDKNLLDSDIGNVASV